MGPLYSHHVTGIHPTSIAIAPRLGSFSIHFCNICSRKSNFPSVKHHPFTSSYLLSEIQLSKAASPLHYQISNYNLYHHFHCGLSLCLQRCLMHVSGITSLLTLMATGSKSLSLLLPYFCLLLTLPLFL